MPDKPECYGSMFPDLSRLEYNRPCKGKAFTALATSQGIGTQSRNLTVDDSAWASCQACAVYRSCYELCMAKLTLNGALARL